MPDARMPSSAKGYAVTLVGMFAGLVAYTLTIRAIAKVVG